MADKKERTKENESEKLGAADAVLAVFYVIIILTGIDLCRTRGLGASNVHLAAVTLSTFGIVAAKLFKYIAGGKAKVKEHLSDIIFAAVLFLLSAAAFVTTVIM